MIEPQAQLCSAAFCIRIFSAFFRELARWIISPLGLAILKSMGSQKWRAKLQDSAEYLAPLLWTQTWQPQKTHSETQSVWVFWLVVEGILEYWLCLLIHEDHLHCRIKAQNTGWELISRITQILLKIYLHSLSMEFLQVGLNFDLWEHRKGKIESCVLGGGKNLRLSVNLKVLKAHPNKSFLKSRYFLSSHHKLIYSFFRGWDMLLIHRFPLNTQSEHSQKST